MSYQQYSLEGGSKLRKKFNISIKYVAIVVGIILICGVLIAHFITHRNVQASLSDHKSSTNAVSSTNASQNNRVNSTQPISKTDASQLITNFYNQYIGAAKKKKRAEIRDNLIKQDGTSKLASYYYPGTNYIYTEDPILCAQATPHGVSLFNLSTSTYSATGIVSESFSTGPININFNLAKQGNMLKIETLKCNPPLNARYIGP